MNHDEAIRSGAAEKYVLRELSDELRDAYEDHFLECAECTKNMHALSGFAEGGAEVYDNLHAEVASSKPKSIWARFFQPSIAIPAFAAIALVLAVVGYQTSRTTLNNSSSNGIAAVSGTSALTDATRGAIRLFGDERKGSAQIPVVRIHAGQGFTLNFDFLSPRKFDSYLGKLQDSSGRLILPVTLSGDMANREVNLAVPAGLVHAGKYTLSFVGVSSTPKSANNPPSVPDTTVAENHVQSFTFDVEFIQ
jgi:hypothetical protein